MKEDICEHVCLAEKGVSSAHSHILDQNDDVIYGKYDVASVYLVYLENSAIMSG